MQKREYRRYIKEKKFMKRLERQVHERVYSYHSGSGSFILKWFLHSSENYVQKYKTTSGYNSYYYGDKKIDRKNRRNIEKMKYYNNIIKDIDSERIPFRIF